MVLVESTLDIQLVKRFKRTIPLTKLVKFGSLGFESFTSAASYFNESINIQRSGTQWQATIKWIEPESKIESHSGISLEDLSLVLLNSVDASTLYWLDGCQPNLASEGSNTDCRLLEEVKLIGSLNYQSIIMIDNAKSFIVPSANLEQWISFDEILRSLRELSAQHRIIVINDILVFYPISVHDAIVSYAVNAHALKFKEKPLSKESELHIKLLEKKEQSLRIQSNIIRAASLPGLGHVLRMIGWLYGVFAPRLGDLNQYQPRAFLSSLDAQPKIALVDSPKISIVTPSYNQGGYIEKTLRSVLDQGYPNLEYFVQDGGSTDDTVEVLKRYGGQLTGWVSERDSGQSQAINRGFSHANGEIMGWLNSDDLLLPNTLNIVATYFEEHPEVDVVYGNRLLIDQNDMEIGRWILPGHDGNVLSWADFIPQETLFWRKRIWHKVGSEIDESFRFAMDWDLILRFRGVGAKFAHIPRFLGAFRIHECQKTSAVINDIGSQEMARIRLRELGRVPTRGEVRVAILTFITKHIIVDLAFRSRRFFNEFFH